MFSKRCRLAGWIRLTLPRERDEPAVAEAVRRFMRGHPPQRHTRILRVARDESGSERFWQRYIGQNALQADDTMWRFATALGW